MAKPAIRMVDPSWMPAMAVVLSARPGRIRAIHDVKLERPRDVFKVRFTPAFSEQHEQLWDELKDDVAKLNRAIRDAQAP